MDERLIKEFAERVARLEEQDQERLAFLLAYLQALEEPDQTSANQTG